MNAGGRRGGLVTVPSSTTSPSQRRHNSIVKQNSSVDDGEVLATKVNLPSEERLSELASKLSV